MARIFEDNSQSIGNTPLVRLNRITQGAGRDGGREDRGAQPGLLGEVPHRRRDDLGRRARRAARAGLARADHRRADERQHRHRAGLRRAPRAATRSS